jgi:DNA mismatch repair protein MutS2
MPTPDLANFSLDALEYPSLKELLARYVRSEVGRGHLHRLGPTLDREDLEFRHALNREAMTYLRESRVPFADIPLLAQLLPRLGLIGTTFEIEEIEAVQDFLSEVRTFRTRWRDEGTHYPLLAGKAQGFPNLGSLTVLLERAIRAGEINEDFSPALKRIRRESEKARQRLNRKLESVIKDPHVSDQLQDQLVTMRNGRYVIPVRMDQRRRVDGVIHGTSSSGATVFMEPLDTLEMNNDIVRLREDEEREVQRILGELSDKIRESALEINSAAVLWADLEVLFGVAQFGCDFDCTSPEFSDGEIVLVRARHPLLEDRMRTGDQMPVPLELDLAADDRILVISGPNAGGKTIVLKTIGLFALMAQSGIPVPAERAVLPLADRVLADIGDQQSIANQLSTFSAHILSISKMVAVVTPRSLILMDEIGSSTEPAEGAALAVAVLDHFRKNGCRTVATTHYNRLKMYAETTPAVRNAAMEFNEATLEPTYRLIHGLAGQSSGLKIAERMKLPGELLRVAREALDRSELDAARYVEELKVRITNLEHEKSQLEGEKAQLEGEKATFELWKRSTSKEIEQDRRTELARVETRIDQVVEQIRKKASDELKSLGSEAVNRFDKKLKKARVDAGATIRREERQREEQMSPEPPALPVDPASIKAGSRVRVRSLGVEGIVSNVSTREVEVGVGNMKMRRPFNDIELVDATAIVLPSNVSFNFDRKQLDSNEINLIGRNAEEARDEVDKFLDDAFLSQLSMVRIVHGHGMGVLRKTVREILGAHPHVARFEEAPRSQGGSGATLAYLKE